jgi:hypothetical protein
MTDRREINVCPEYFQERLTHVGGVNKYDEPNFKLVWAQYETYVAGGVWSVDEQYFRGYRRLLLGSGEPCWALLQWHAAEEYGTPESYYVSNLDPDTGLQILGEYPYGGRYELLYHLRWNEMIDGKLTFHTMPLNNYVIDTVVPIILLAKDVSYEKRKAAYEELRRREEESKRLDIENHLRERTPAELGTGAVSFSRQSVRSTLIDQKMIALQRAWNNLARTPLPKGMSTK